MAMQIQYGFSAVTLVAMMSLRAQLDEGEWGKVKAVGLDKLEGQSVEVVLKAVLLHLLAQATSSAAASGEEELAGIDGRWDRAQRRLALALLAALQSEVEAERLAGQALGDALLDGPSGSAQTTWSYQREADWGARQVELAATPALAGHVKALKLGGHIKDIGATTDELLGALGRTPGDVSKEAPHQRERRIQRELAAVLNSGLSHFDMVVMYSAGAARALALRQPLADLLIAR